jgi:hypothetical protein
MRLGNRLIGAACFLAALVLNPNVGCSSTDPGESPWTYTESQMQEAVVGTYEGAADVDGAPETVTVTITRPTRAGGSTPSSLRLQCGSRNFLVKPADACISVSNMPVVATSVSAGNAVPSGQFTGTFTAYYTLTGQLELTGDRSDRLTASYEGGSFVGWEYAGPDGRVLPLSLARR